MLALLAVFAASVAAAQTTALNGRWVLNVGQSDRGGDMIQPTDTGGVKPRQSPLGGGGLGGDGFGGFHPHGAQRTRVPNAVPLNDQQRARMRQTLELALDAPDTLTINASDSTVQLVADTTSLVLRADGPRQVVHVPPGGDVEIQARWQGHDFSVERKVAGGGTVTEDYFHAPQTAQLYVVIGFDGAGGRAVFFRRVYDPAPSN